MIAGVRDAHSKQPELTLCPKWRSSCSESVAVKGLFMPEVFALLEDVTQASTVAE